MILDKNLELSSGQSIVSTAIIYSTNTLDTEVASSNIGAGTPIWVVCKVATVFTGSGTLNVTLVDCATSGGTYISLYQTLSYSLGETDAVGDNLMVIPLPATSKRYIKLRYNNAHNSGAAGAVDAYLALNAPLK